MNQLKVFSLERTFSNFLIRTLQDNFVEYNEDEQIKSPWKHEVPRRSKENMIGDDVALSNAIEDEDTEVHFFFPVKHPYKWTISYFRGWKKGALGVNHYKEHAGDGILVQYIDKMPPEPDDEVFLKALTEKYNQWLRHAMCFVQEHKKAELFDYEYILHNPTGLLDEIMETYDLLPSQAIWQIPGKEIAPDQSVTSKTYDDSYWTKGDYMDDLTDLQKDILDKRIDWKLVEMAGM